MLRFLFVSGVCSARSACLLLALTVYSLGQPYVASAAKADPPSFSGQETKWNGFRRFDFEVDGRPALVVVPHQPAPGRPWVWHGEFFGHKPAPDVELLRRGFHIAYLRVPNMLGSPDAVKHWNQFYQLLTTRHQLAQKVALVGLSRGGLYCYNWAIQNPDKVACVYGDAPVCDFKSWPGGFGKGTGSSRDWQLVLDRYGFQNEKEALDYKHNPVDQLAPLANAGVPLLHVYGDADPVVPWEENTGLLATRYRSLGGSISLICKPGVAHHPHGLNDPTPIVDFIQRHAGVEPTQSAASRRTDPVREMAAKLEPSRQVVFKVSDNRELYLHVFEPDDWRPRDRRACLLVIHGGGWGGGEPRRMYPFADHFRRLGMVGISLHYRRLNAKQGTSVFDCVADARSAVRFIRSHASTLGIDPDRLVVSGASAGGHLAVGTAVFDEVNDQSDDLEVPCSPAALVLLFPVIDTSAAGYGQAKIGDRWRELSPLLHVDDQVPPTLIFHGSADNVTPLAGAKQFTARMSAAGNACQLEVHPNGKHGYLMFDRQLFEKTLARMEQFLVAQKLLIQP